MNRMHSTRSLNSLRAKPEEGAANGHQLRPTTAGGTTIKPRRDVTDAEMANFQRLFQTFDVDRSGYLEFGELQLLLRCLGIKIDDATMEVMRDEFDEDGNGILDFEEFVSFMIRSYELKHLRVVSDEEEQEHIRNPTKSHRFTPDTVMRWLWDTIILCTTIYFILRVPIDVWLVAIGEHHMLSPYEITVEIVLTAIFIIDIGIQINTIVVTETGKCVDNLSETFLSYAKSTMAFDVIAALPIDLIILAIVGHSCSYVVDTTTTYNTTTVTSLTSAPPLVAVNTTQPLIEECKGYYQLPVYFVFRFAHLFKFFRIILTLYEGKSATGVLTPTYVYLHYHTSPILKSGFYFVTVVHTLTIGYLITCYLSDRPADSYIDALYLVLYTLTTVGYGDVVVSSWGQRLYCCGLFLCGALVNGIVISQMSVFLQKANIESERHDKMRETLAVLHHFDIPSKSQTEILSFQAHTLEHNLGSSHEALVSSLPGSIQDNLALFMKIKWISMVSMFEKASHEAMVSLANSLVNIIIRPQEFIIIAGEMGREMYFLGHGIADVILPSGNWIATIRKGGFFGEIALLVEGAPRTASIKALTYCDIFRLERGDFSAILNKFPAFRDSIQDEVEKRIEAFRKSNATSIVPQRRKERKTDGMASSASGQSFLDSPKNASVTKSELGTDPASFRRELSDPKVGDAPRAVNRSGSIGGGHSLTQYPNINNSNSMRTQESIRVESVTSGGGGNNQFSIPDATSVQSLAFQPSMGEFRGRRRSLNPTSIANPSSLIREDLKRQVMDFNKNTLKLGASTFDRPGPSPRSGGEMPRGRSGHQQQRSTGGWMGEEGTGGYDPPGSPQGTGGYNPRRRSSGRRSQEGFGDMDSFAAFQPLNIPTNTGVDSPADLSPRASENELKYKIRELERALEMERSRNRPTGEMAASLNARSDAIHRHSLGGGEGPFDSLAGPTLTDNVNGSTSGGNNSPISTTRRAHFAEDAEEGGGGNLFGRNNSILSVDGPLIGAQTTSNSGEAKTSAVGEPK